MALNRVILFLFGATIASAQYFHEMSVPYEVGMLPSGCPPMSELAPVICKLMQHNIDLPYKPQLIAPSTYIPPLMIENCDTPKLQMEIELPMPFEEKKPLFIPAPPALPPITLPKFPVPVMIEEPIAPAVEPCEPAFVPDLPQIVELPEIKEPEFKPMVIPQPPELPAFVMPELPVRVAIPPPVIAEPCLEDQFMNVVPMTEYVEQAVPELPILPEIEELPKVDFKPIPAPPELPAFVMPELPVRVAEPPMMIAPCPEDELIKAVPVPEYIKPLAAIPAPPALPPATLPKLPVEIPTQQMIIERTVEEPCLTEELMLPKAEPVFIPTAPRMPHFVMPESVEIRKPMSMPIFPTFPEATINGEPCETEKMAELAPYFRTAPYVAFSNEKVVNDFRFMNNMELLSLPYMHRV